MRTLVFTIFIHLIAQHVQGQGCCAGGSGSPIAGGVSQGVLAERQLEISTNFQYVGSDRFKSGKKDTAKLFDDFKSRYLYSKVAYGITKNFTFSLEAGYYLSKIQTSLYDSVLEKSEVVHSSGIADLVIFPRYDILNSTTESRRTEITIGLGYKVPLGSHTDSMLVYTNPSTGQQFFTTSPPLVQPTNGSHDVIGYLFFYRGFPLNNFRVFSNLLYIRKGWNSLGEKFGDYSSFGIFAGKTFSEKIGITLQVKGELTGKMKAAKNTDLLAYYNVDVASTGSKKISFVPQVSFNHKSLTLFALYELPLYEYVNGAQVASKHLFTAGISYRFYTSGNKIPDTSQMTYSCSMKCEGGGSNSPGNCSVCGMKLKKN